MLMVHALVADCCAGFLNALTFAGMGMYAYVGSCILSIPYDESCWSFFQRKRWRHGLGKLLRTGNMSTSDSILAIT